MRTYADRHTRWQRITHISATQISRQITLQFLSMDVHVSHVPVSVALSVKGIYSSCLLDPKEPAPKGKLVPPLKGGPAGDGTMWDRPQTPWTVPQQQQQMVQYGTDPRPFGLYTSSSRWYGIDPRPKGEEILVNLVPLLCLHTAQTILQ